MVSLEECEALKLARFQSEAERPRSPMSTMIAGPEVPDDVFNAVRKHYSKRDGRLTVLSGPS